LEWCHILSYSLMDDGATFAIEYSRTNKKPKLVKFSSTFAVYMKESFERVHQERARCSLPVPCLQAVASG
uniref:Heat shock 70 kDa protein 14 n=1 Tax=Anisakis simplex TaxID=6269 RepID=A0A0M3JFV0_ANISI